MPTGSAGGQLQGTGSLAGQLPGGGSTSSLTLPTTGVVSDSGTNNTPTAIEVDHDTSATPAVGFGLTALLVKLMNNARARVQAATIAVVWGAVGAGAETAKLLLTLKKAGTDTLSYTFDPDTFTMASSIAKIAFPNSSIFQDISLINLNFTMFSDFVVGAAGALATNASRGFLQIPTCAGPPTGTLAAFTTGKIALVYDTTNNKLWSSVGGGVWKGVVFA